jgi:regulator of protease activity HflC (stomatin/prohibitin superfamily)
MPQALPVITAVAGVATVVGTVASISQQRKATRAQQQQQQLQAQRSRRAAIRQAQLQRAQQQAAAMGMGVVGGSGLAGGAASLSSQTGAALGYSTQMSGLSKEISLASQRANTAQGIAGLSSQVFSSFGGFQTLFPEPKGAGAPSPEALLRGVG